MDKEEEVKSWIPVQVIGNKYDVIILKYIWISKSLEWNETSIWVKQKVCHV